MAFTDSRGRTWKTYRVEWKAGPGDMRLVGNYEAPTRAAALKAARTEHRSRYGNGAEDRRYMKSMRVVGSGRVNPSAKRPKKGKLSKRVPAALSKFFRKVNPALKHATHVRIKTFKDGGFSVRPA